MVPQRAMCFSMRMLLIEVENEQRACVGTLESITNSESVDIPAEAARKGRADRRTFAVAVVVVVRLPGPVRGEIVGKGAVWGLILRL